MVAARAAAKAAAQALSEQDVAAVRAELDGGKAVTVWFTLAAVGVPAGGSAKVVAVGDPGEGDFIQIRPTGSRDTMFCSPGELTRTRPARPAKPAAPKAAAPKPAAPEPAAPEPAAPPPVVPEPAAPTSVASEPIAATAAVPPKQPVAAAAIRTPERAAPRAAARPSEVTVTLNASAEGEWTVEVSVGKKRTVRAVPVQPGDVAAAARALPAPVAEAISSTLDAARQRRLDQVERLRAELEAAEQALQELTD